MAKSMGTKAAVGLSTIGNLGTGINPVATAAPDPIDKSTQIRFLTCGYFPQLPHGYVHTP